jgi:hypothetical protein
MKNRALFVLGVSAIVLFVGCNAQESSVTVTRVLPATVRGGENFTVYLTMAVNGKLNAVGLEEDYPSGWVVSNNAPRGVLKNNPDRIEWLFLPIGEPIINRTISYTITAPKNYSGPASFNGKVIAKETNPITGDTSINVIN